MNTSGETSMSYYSGPAVAVLGFLTVWCVNALIEQCIPNSAKKTTLNAWKWKNTAVSLIHSFFSGVCAVICLYNKPELAEDVVNISTNASHLLLSFSTGYFVFDFFDIVRNNPYSRSTYELIIHHAAVTLCFTISTFTKRYIGFGVISLIVELNSVFLHMRQILNFQSYPRDSKFARLNSVINIASFVVFRFLTLAWLARWLIQNPDKVPFPVYICGCVSVSTICFTSTILFFRLLFADFFRRSAKISSHHDYHRLQKPSKEALNGFHNNNGASSSHYFPISSLDVATAQGLNGGKKEM